MGDRVAIAMRNYPEWPVAFFAAASIGAVVVPLNAWWVADELEFGLVDSGARPAAPGRGPRGGGGREHRADADAEALREHLAQRVARFKIPAHIVVQSDELPRNASGKLVKKDIDLDQFAPDPAD